MARKSFTLEDARRSAFSLQAYDADWRPIGLPLEVPAGTEDATSELPWAP